MDKFIVKGGKALGGEVVVSGAKNVALKTLVAACLTEEEVVIENVPLISDFFVMVDLIKELGGTVAVEDHTARIKVPHIVSSKISLDKAAEVRTSSMFLAPLLARLGRASIPNPGGCRIGARPIDRTVEGIKALGADIAYESGDGYFHAKIKSGARLKGVSYRFEKSSHTATETLMIASSCAYGKTVLENAAQEPEIDELIALLNAMGAHIRRISPRTIEIIGVNKLHGARFRIGPDRNEVVTFAIAAYITQGNILVREAKASYIQEFLDLLQEAGAEFKEEKNGMRFFSNGSLKATSIITCSYPGFMTDWQGPWAVLMAKAQGESIIHETIYENRFGYVSELLKMGARIDLFTPSVRNPRAFYNFTLPQKHDPYHHAIKIYGPAKLHNAAVQISDLRAGATLVLAALAASGESVIFGAHHIDRGYERFEERLQSVGADIKRMVDE
ncbi:MAG: UDP-N-acetylglucosamine 1-carboxyvinyltransferase [Candidatus Levybacteria bacterium RIFCSPHIGHO2_02_FULL_42_12]|nr:MAG: UDP-N-acetylglucosamine 1-carboxyvinyltransferase [Candidatus Levybacteria bacterium RIFCSPHIGHO2_01_FULL_42_15]OGH33957.1 MAG: UDP-N-acetylglucosamine 1-carboxyvinyltransferase [Candidatus Levybacteria bacterium RIFCSPHIGHO2_02_FULL_42_12]OGH42892.1 MAG: UDP-N-acetylglucosamine 1-carboxyvinyltransferase [Candidatus Levybacteria bacterium RIFCSPLOWO2_01_FULL_42_15]